jgi:hypothetical protein
MTFNINAHSTSAFVQYSIGWFVVDKSSHSDSLFLTTTQNVIPIIDRSPASFSLNQVAKFHFIKDGLKIIIRNVSFLLILNGVWIDELIS